MEGIGLHGIGQSQGIGQPFRVLPHPRCGLGGFPQMVTLAPHAKTVTAALPDGGILVFQGHDTEVGIVQVGILGAVVIRIVGNNDRNIVLNRPFFVLGPNKLLFFEAVVLDLQIKMLSKGLFPGPQGLLGLGFPVIEQGPRDFGIQGTGGGHQAFAVREDQFPTHTGNIIIAFGVR